MSAGVVSSEAPSLASRGRSSRHGGSRSSSPLASWLPWASVAVHRRFPSCGEQALGLEGFCSCSMQAQKLWHTGFVAPWPVGSSQTRDRTHVLCIGRQILKHRTIRKPLMTSLKILYLRTVHSEVLRVKTSIYGFVELGEDFSSQQSSIMAPYLILMG